MQNKFKTIIFTSAILLLPGLQFGQKPTASDIMDRVDKVINGPLDQKITMELKLIDRNGDEKIREIVMYQKGNNKRMTKFLAPADQRGIGFLSLPNGKMYLYLPAFQKVRRIAGHIKNNRFAGTDMTYEDMEAINYNEKWQPELLEDNNDYYILQLKPKENIKTGYGSLKIWVLKDKFFPTRIEYYNKKNKLIKILTREAIEKIDGCWIARKSTMENLKTKHTTVISIKDAKFNSGLSDNIFTKRYLKR